MMSDLDEIRLIVRALELLGESYAELTCGNEPACDAAMDRAILECGEGIISMISGNMMVGWCPEPWHEAWPEFLARNRGALARAEREHRDQVHGGGECPCAPDGPPF